MPVGAGEAHVHTRDDGRTRDANRSDGFRRREAGAPVRRRPSLHVLRSQAEPVQPFPVLLRSPPKELPRSGCSHLVRFEPSLRRHRSLGRPERAWVSLENGLHRLRTPVRRVLWSTLLRADDKRNWVFAHKGEGHVQAPRTAVVAGCASGRPAAAVNACLARARRRPTPWEAGQSGHPGDPRRGGPHPVEGRVRPDAPRHEVERRNPTSELERPVRGVRQGRGLAGPFEGPGVDPEGFPESWRDPCRAGHVACLVRRRGHHREDEDGQAASGSAAQPLGDGLDPVALHE